MIYTHATVHTIRVHIHIQQNNFFLIEVYITALGLACTLPKTTDGPRIFVEPMHTRQNDTYCVTGSLRNLYIY